VLTRRQRLPSRRYRNLLGERLAHFEPKLARSGIPLGHRRSTPKRTTKKKTVVCKRPIGRIHARDLIR
jgi:hypothetical protein